jgi:hypothetical protein
MKTLATIFTKKDWLHEQVIRCGQVAIFRRQKETSPAPHYEVVKIRQNEAREQFGTMIPAAESYPGENQWGQQGFTFGTLGRAFDRFRELVEKENTKPVVA